MIPCRPCGTGSAPVFLSDAGLGPTSAGFGPTSAGPSDLNGCGTNIVQTGSRTEYVDCPTQVPQTETYRVAKPVQTFRTETRSRQKFVTKTKQVPVTKYRTEQKMVPYQRSVPYTDYETQAYQDEVQEMYSVPVPETKTVYEYQTRIKQVPSTKKCNVRVPVYGARCGATTIGTAAFGGTSAAYYGGDTVGYGAVDYGAVDYGTAANFGAPVSTAQFGAVDYGTPANFGGQLVSDVPYEASGPIGTVDGGLVSNVQAGSGDFVNGVAQKSGDLLDQGRRLLPGQDNQGGEAAADQAGANQGQSGPGRGPQQPGPDRGQRGPGPRDQNQRGPGPRGPGQQNNRGPGPRGQPRGAGPRGNNRRGPARPSS